MFGFNRKGQKPPPTKLTVVPNTCAYCPRDSRVAVLWPGDVEREYVCDNHGRMVHEGLMEVEMLTRLESV